MRTSVGMTRRIDELGRLVIPVELRRRLNINSGDEIVAVLGENEIILEKSSNNHGVARKIDSLGRIVIPKENRDRLGMEPGKAVELFIEDGKIAFKLYNPGCIFCGGLSKGMKLYGKRICKDCVEAIQS